MKTERKFLSFLLAMTLIFTTVAFVSVPVSAYETAEDGWVRLVYQGIEQTSRAGQNVIWDIGHIETGKIRITYDLQGTRTIGNEELALVDSNKKSFGIAQHSTTQIQSSYANGNGGKMPVVWDLRAGQWYNVQILIDLDADSVDYSVLDSNGRECVEDKVGQRQRYNSDVDSVVLWTNTDTNITRKNFIIDVEGTSTPDPEGYVWVKKVIAANNYNGEMWSGEPDKVHLPEPITHGKVKVSYEIRRSDDGKEKTYTRLVDASGKETDGRGSIMSIGSKLSVGKSTAEVIMLNPVPTNEFSKVEVVIDLDTNNINYYARNMAGGLLGMATGKYAGGGFGGVNIYNWNDSVPYVRNYTIEAYEPAHLVTGEPPVEIIINPPVIETETPEETVIIDAAVEDGAINKDGKAVATYNVGASAGAPVKYTFIVGCYDAKGAVLWGGWTGGIATADNISPEIVIPEEYRGAAQVKTYLWKGL